MKIKLTFFLLCLLLITNGISPTMAQVTVGSNLIPEKAALLDIKEIESKEGGATANKGGLVLPRVNLEKKYQLYPFIREAGYNASNFDDPDYDPNADATYAAEKPAHKGLIVYNLIENDDEELCLGLNQWDGEKWNCFEEKMGNAIAELGNCDSLQFIGQYQNKVALGAGNYMTIPLHVKKAGAYTLTARPDPDNGYYFTASGVFLTPGYYFISVPGAGTPIKFTPDGEPGDLMKITFNNKPMDACNPKYVVVEDSSVKPLYVMDCSKTKVRGVYKLDKALDETNFIEMTLDVDLEGVGAKYIIQTNTVDGIYFKGEGLLTGTTTQVILKGYGTPTSLNDKHFTITSNSKKTVATCEAKVIVVIPKKRIYSLGHDAGYGYNLASGSVARTLLEKAINFGVEETSTIKTEMSQYDFIVPGMTGIPSATEVNNIVNELKNNKPDIVLITQDIYVPDNVTLRRSMMDAFTEYLNNKGVVLLFWEGNPNNSTGGVQRFFSDLFNVSAIRQARGQGAGSIYKLTNIDDAILNGPFGDVRGKYWGEDASWAMSLTNLPLGEFDIYSYGDDYSGNSGTLYDITGNIVGLKHKTMNLVFFGDGGFISAPDAALTNGNGYGGSATICPFAFDPATFKPKAKSGYGAGSTKYDVQNSIIFFNTFAWAVRQAQFNGINTKK